ncbi:MAG: hypothetical protein HKM93_14275 [Desulfobacteraceae bacterium]|nr:hypothetical protein [Desulfobacteraceae bacterium]
MKKVCNDLFINALVLLLVVGCSLPVSYRQADRKTMGDAGNIRRYDHRLGMVRIENQTPYRDDRIESTIFQTMNSILEQNCSRLQLQTYKDESAPLFFNALPKSDAGIMNNFILAQQGRENGLHAILVLRLTGIDVLEEKAGIMMFRKSKYYLQIQVISELLDTYTGAKLMNDTTMTRLKIDESDAENIRRAEGSADPLVIEKLVEITSDIAESACRALQTSQWRVMVLSAEGNQVVISAGSAVGVEVGDRFDIFDGSRIIEGADGETFVLPGYKIGEIQVTGIYPNRAEAVIETNTSVPSGSIVIPAGFSFIE